MVVDPDPRRQAAREPPRRARRPRAASEAEQAAREAAPDALSNIEKARLAREASRIEDA
jgi:hypothetical protein